ncbi:Crp/Fnr family transcriptional regulator [Nonomuraea cavernae]|uniref:Crp/Fnr family transcriptional regulator n=1 Tax=Nonomuraea cavernae TaxID=2045107 RepID=UPI0033C43C0F
MEAQGLGVLIPGDAWQALLAAGVPRTFLDGEVVLRQGDQGGHVLALTNGRVKVTLVDIDGREMVLAIRGAGEILGEISVIDGGRRSATVTAWGRCIAYQLPAARFLRIVDEFRIRDTLLRLILARYREGEAIRAELIGLPALQRVGRVLLWFAGMTANHRNGESGLDLRLSQEELASAVGLSRAAVAAALSSLRKQGVITTSRRLITVRDLPKLRAVGHAPNADT